MPEYRCNRCRDLQWVPKEGTISGALAANTDPRQRMPCPDCANPDELARPIYSFSLQITEGLQPELAVPYLLEQLTRRLAAEWPKTGKITYEDYQGIVSMETH